MVAYPKPSGTVLTGLLAKVGELFLSSTVKGSQRLRPKRTFIVFLLFLSACAFSVEAATVVTSEELLQDPEKYDGQSVIYKGEAIGDILLQGESAWVNLRDQAGALGVFCPRGLIGQITYLGDYLTKGDIVSVRGIFNRSCPQHGGDTDIHAEKITIVQQGRAVTRPVEPEKIKLAIILGIIVFILAIVHLIIRKLR